jgi:hypothetical protein
MNAAQMVLSAAAIVLAAGSAAAQDFTCPSVSNVYEKLGWALYDARDAGGESFGDYGRLLAEASAYAAAQTGGAGWPEPAVDALGRIRARSEAIAARDGTLEADDITGLLADADLLAIDAVRRCGAASVPALLRPGEADARACHAVIRALEDFEKRLPVITGENTAYRPVMVAVGSTSKWALTEATRSQWSAASLETLAHLAEVAPRYASGEIVPDAESGAALIARMQAVAAEAYPICGTFDIPLYVGAK